MASNILQISCRVILFHGPNPLTITSISGLVAEYIVAIDVTRVRFPADALFYFIIYFTGYSVVCGQSHHKLARFITSGVAQWLACWAHNPKVRGSKPRSAICIWASMQSYRKMDTLGIEPRASRMLSGCDTTTPRALWKDSICS